MKPSFVSLFAGIGGFDLAFERAGMEGLCHVELDKNCRRLLRAKFPNALSYDDVTTFRRFLYANPEVLAGMRRVAVGCGGSPCQDLSMAGLRQGLDGQRSGLFFEMVRIWKLLRPRIVVWENVDGAFSSNEGRDFASVLRAFTGLQVEVPQDGWGRAGFVRSPFPGLRWDVAWRRLDAQYFGVPQRRDRVYLVGHLRDPGGVAGPVPGNAGGVRSLPLEILFEPDCLQGNPAPRGAAWEEVAATVVSCAGGSRTTALEGPGYIVGALCANGRAAGSATLQDATSGKLVISPPVTSKWAKGSGGPAGDECQNLIAFDGAQITSKTNRSQPDVGKPAPPLTKSGREMLAFYQQGSTPSVGIGALKASMGRSSHSGGVPMVAFSSKGDGGDAGDPAPCLRAMNFDQSHLNGGGQMAVTEPNGVRRFTPRECERLQGFPDDWTAGFSDSVRYRMEGNAVAVVCAEWLGKRIVEALQK